MDYANIPAAAPPAGEHSDFTHPKTLKTSLIAVNATFLPLMLLVVAIRLYSRGRIVRAIGWDDYTCLLAALGSVVHTILMLWDIHLGYGTHLWDIRAITLLPSHLRDIEGLAILYPIVIFLVKLSISLLYLRLFGVQKTFRYFVYSGVVFCFLFYTAFMGTQIGTLYLCNGPNESTHSLCRNGDVLVIVSGVINVVTDFYLLALPIPSLAMLKLQHRRKLGLLAMFMAGLMYDGPTIVNVKVMLIKAYYSACLVSLARLIFASVRLHDVDTLYNAALTTELTSVELNTGIITASMPAMPHFFAKSKIFQSATYSSLRSRLFGDRSRSKSPGGSSASKQSRIKTPFEAVGGGMHGDGYLELEDIKQFHTLKGQKSRDEDDSSGKGILQSADYGLSVGSDPGNFTARQGIEA